jgi:DNA-binding response OmpR family regulator
LRIALLEDDPHTGQLLSLWLAEAGHDAELYATGKDFFRAVLHESFDLMVLDWMLPDTSGDKVLLWIREHIDWPIPVLFVTARDSEEDIVEGLTKGADDYMVKPVRQKELTARIMALSRRGQVSRDDKEVLEVGPFRIDTSARSISSAGANIELTQKEYELAVFFFRNVGRMLSRGHILESVWGHGPGLSTRTVDTHVSRIRSKLGITPESGWRLGAIYHYGYRLEPPNE